MSHAQSLSLPDNASLFTRPFETTLEHKNDVDFLSKRYRETHDLWRVWAAYRRGHASPLFLDVWFEEQWETPVATLRARLCAPAKA
jgi:ubiquinone biosynthesis protein Coq4